MSLLLWLKAWKKLSTFGANIAITPKRESLQISCGGIPLGNALVDNGHIPLAGTLRAIAGIPLKDRISVVAPNSPGWPHLPHKPRPGHPLCRLWALILPASLTSSNSARAGGHSRH